MSVAEARVGLRAIAWEWGRIGCTGFGGPPAHIALFRRLCVAQRSWMSAQEFEDGVAATNLLPGPASTQLAIFCAWRLRGPLGAVVGGLSFIVPGLILILALAALFLARHPPLWVAGAAAGASAAVPAVAVQAAVGLVPASRRRAGAGRGPRGRALLYLIGGAVAAAAIGPWLVAVLAACGIVEVTARLRSPPPPPFPPPGEGHSLPAVALPLAALKMTVAAGLGALCWVAFKVGALSYGGGFVIIPLIQHDAVSTYHWMSSAQFLNAVALGQVTPGPVVLTVAVVGFASAGVGGGLLAVLIAFSPSFLFVIFGGPYFDRIRASRRVQAFLTGAGASVVGAIAGSAVPLGLGLSHLWQVALLGGAGLWLLVWRRGVVGALVCSGVLGVLFALAGAPTGP